MIEAYARLLCRCGTVNRINRAHIVLADRLSPPEFDDIRREMPPRSAVWSGRLSQSLRRRGGLVADTMQRLRPKTVFPPEAYEWAELMSDWMDRSGKSAPEAFVRRRVRRNVFSYSDGAPTASKTLVVGFTGVAGRLFMPIPVFLQHLCAERFDVLLLRDPSKHGYRNGLPGVADDFETLVEAIGTFFDRAAYRHVVTYGTSGGGLPAIVTALRLGLDKAVSVAGRDPHDPRWQTVGPGGVGEMLRRLVRASASPPNVLLVHGADSERDVASARALAEFLPVRTLTVHGRDGAKLGHNAVFPLVLESRFRQFLATALDPDLAGFGDAAGPDSRIDV